MAFTHTSTRTFTHILIIGEELAKKDEALQLAADKMKEMEQKYKDEMKEKGIRFKETDNEEDLELMRKRWEKIMPGISNDLNETPSILELIKEKDQEPSTEWKLRMK